MFSELVDTYKDSVIYSLGNLANKIVGFILIPLYTAYIPLAEYGILGLIEPLSQFLFTFLGLGINSAFMLWYSTEKDNLEKTRIFFNSHIIIFFSTGIVLTILILFSTALSNLLFNSPDYSLMLKISLMNVFFLVINPLMFSTLRIERKAIRYAGITILQFVINLLLNIFFIVELEYGLISIFISQLISSAVVFVIFIPSYIRRLKFAVNFVLIRQLLKFGLPLIWVGISNVIITMLNRYILVNFADLESVGLFSFAFKISNTIKVLIIESMTLSLTPILYKKLTEPNGNHFVRKNYLYSAFIVMLTYILFSSFARELIYFTARNQEYHDAYRLIPLLGLVYLFNTTNYFYNILLGFTKNTKIIAKITVITAVLSIILNVVLIPLFNSYGAAIGLMLSSVIVMVYSHYEVQKFYQDYFDNAKILMIFLFSILIILINFSFFMDISIINFLIKISICFLFPIVLYLFKFIREQDIKKGKVPKD